MWGISDVCNVLQAVLMSLVIKRSTHTHIKTILRKLHLTACIYPVHLYVSSAVPFKETASPEIGRTVSLMSRTAPINVRMRLVNGRFVAEAQ